MVMDGQTIVITGGGSGIGLATARAVVAQGAHVVIAGRTPEKLAQARAVLGPRARTHVLDALREEDVRAFFSDVGPFDHLVTAAGPQAGDVAFLDMDMAAVRERFDAKFWTQYHAVKHGAPLVRAGGSIVLFSGWMGRKPMLGVSTYAAIDGAIEALTKNLALELAPIRINAVNPGVIATPLWDSLPEEMRRGVLDGFAHSLPVGRVGTPEDVSKAVLFLMDNGFATGAIVDVDGGIK